MDDIQSKQMCCSVINTLKLTLSQRYSSALAQRSVLEWLVRDYSWDMKNA